MTADPPLAAVPAPEEPSEDWPEDWTPGAVDAVETVLVQRPDLDGPEWAQLLHAGSLTSQADRLEALARAAGYVSKGSTGQEILHPGAAEARLCRTAAAQIFARLVPVKTSGAMTASERARMAASARWSSTPTRSRKGR